jgi:uncharacterized protein (UPF0548 family)
MKITLTRPTAAFVENFLAGPLGELSYPEVGATALEKPVLGYDNDHNRVKLGDGAAVFETAKEALRVWAQFPEHWVFIAPHAPLDESQTVAMCAHAFGLWWVSAARIVYVIDEESRFGFAYGTLDAHLECGEERFLLEMLPDGSVWYDLRAFSRPRRWFVRLGYPLARSLQRKFVRDSQRSLRERWRSGQIER